MDDQEKRFTTHLCKTIRLMLDRYPGRFPGASKVKPESLGWVGLCDLHQKMLSEVGGLAHWKYWDAPKDDALDTLAKPAKKKKRRKKSTRSETPSSSSGTNRSAETSASSVEPLAANLATDKQKNYIKGLRRNPIAEARYQTMARELGFGKEPLSQNKAGWVITSLKQEIAFRAGQAAGFMVDEMAGPAAKVDAETRASRQELKKYLDGLEKKRLFWICDVSNNRRL